MKKQLTPAQAIEIVKSALRANSFESIEEEAKRFAFPSDRCVSDTLCQKREAVLAYCKGCKSDVTERTPYGRMPGQSIVAAAFRHFGSDREVIKAVCIGNPLDVEFELRFATLFSKEPEVLEAYLLNNPKEDMFCEEVAEMAEKGGWLETIEAVEANVKEKKILPTQFAGNSLADFGLK